MITGLEGRVAIVTGAGSGIGAESARLMLGEGATVIAVDLTIDQMGCPPSADEERWLPMAADISTALGATAIVELAKARFGRLDVLVNCAGIYETGSLEDVDEVMWDRVQSVNLRGAYLLARAAMPLMSEGAHGRIILFSSIAAQTGGGVAAGPAYVSSKAGVIGLTRSLAQAGGPLGVTVNCVSPGVIVTPMTSVLNEETRLATIAKTPLRRLGTTEDVAAIVLMLASDGAGFVSGARIDVNGGLDMR